MMASYEARLHRVLDHVQDDPSGDLSPDALADGRRLLR